MGSEILPVVEVEGGPIQRGREQGEGAKELIHTALDRYRRILPETCGCSWDVILDQAQAFLPPSQASFPDFFQELEGIAEGAEVPFKDVWALNCYQELLEMRPRTPGCTSLAIKADHTQNGHIFLAHNEDWLSVDQETVYLIRSRPKDGPAFLGMTYGPLLANIGFNQAGIGVAINSVFSTDTRLAVPRILYSRAILKARSMESALKACLPAMRAGGYHYLIADRLGNLRSIETSASHHHVDLGEKGWLIHTNHYLSATLISLEAKRDLRNSKLRLHRARELLEPQLGSVNIQALQGLLKDHANQPDSICEHEDQTALLHRRFQTLVSMIVDLTEGVMWAALGPPCLHAYHAYPLAS
jgi:isopenicillin-N N-acyltransferase-like protein